MTQLPFQLRARRVGRRSMSLMDAYEKWMSTLLRRIRRFNPA
ncbi:hypothetical protein K788_0006052 (plasmid) [Paraburkholderia caribensis MBA4]|uniref:Uncharacterized protein n=1 Tax=Paraburkholderia caribensis MBA4 TaxID=1323664 RepID=A0A0P0RR35_9BURK|nr:hypothetical protein K788_0006052 [Paraburkholderia caribensis MBA4]